MKNNFLPNRNNLFLFLFLFLFSFSFAFASSPNLLDGTQGLPSLDSASLSNNTYNVNYTGITNVNNNTFYTNDSFAGNYSNFSAVYGYTLNGSSLWNNNYTNFSIIYGYALNDTNYNASGLIINWSKIISSGAETLWNANYSNFSIIYGYALNLTGGEPFWNANYSNFSTIYGYALNSTGGEPFWNANYSDFLVGYNYAINSTGGGVSWVDIINGTMMSQATYNINYSNFRPLINLTWYETNYTNFRPLINLSWFTTNYTANDALYRSWSLNYSNFSAVYGYTLNGSLTNLTNLSYVPYTGAIGNVTLGKNNLSLNGSILFEERGGVQDLFYVNPVDGDGFRMSYYYNFEVPYDDWLVFQKTDGNDMTPDGGIAFMMSNATGWNKTILKLDSYGLANFTDQNITTTENVTAGFFFGDGRYLINIPETFWNANYSNFSTIYGYALNSTGITWDNAINGTLLSQATYNTNYTNFRPLINLTWYETNYTNFRPLINLTWFTTNYTDFRPLINLTWFTTNYTANDELYRSWSNNYSNFSTKIFSWDLNYSNFSTGWNYALNDSIYLNDTFRGNYSNFSVIYGYILNNSIYLNDTFRGNLSNFTITNSYALNNSLWSLNYSNFSVGWAYSINDTNWNSSGLIIDWNTTGYIKNWQVQITDANTSLAYYTNTTVNDSMKSYVDNKLTTIIFNASAIQVVTGTPQGVIGDLKTYDDLSYNVSEVSSDMELIVNFSGITSFNQIIVRYKSALTESHTMDISLWDTTTSSWESYRTVGGASPDYNIMTMTVYDISDHIVGGVVQVRFYTNNVGGLTHKHQFDWVAISDGQATPSSSETDPFSLHLIDWETNYTNFYPLINLTWWETNYTANEPIWKSWADNYSNFSTKIFSWDLNYSNFSSNYFLWNNNYTNFSTVYGYTINSSSYLNDTFRGNLSNFTVTNAYALNDSLWSLNYSNFSGVYGYALNASTFTQTLFNTNYTAFRPLINLTWWETNYTDFRPLINSSGNNLSWYETNYTNFKPLINLSWYETNYTANDALYRSWSLNFSNFSTKIFNWDNNYSNFSGVYGYALNGTSHWLNSGGLVYNSTATGFGFGVAPPHIVSFVDIQGGVAIRSSIYEDTVAPENGLFVEEEVCIGGSCIANDELNMYEPAPSSYTTMRMSNADGGTGATNGFMLRLGTGTTNDTTLWNYESGAMDFGTNNTRTLLMWKDNSTFLNDVYTQGIKNLSLGYDYALNDSLWSLNFSNFSGVYGYALNASTFTQALFNTNYTDFKPLINLTWWETNYTDFRPLINLTWFTTNYTANDANYRSWANNYSNFSTGYGYALNDSIYLNDTFRGNISNFTTTNAYALNGSLWSLNYSNFSTGWQQAMNGTLNHSAYLYVFNGSIGGINQSAYNYVYNGSVPNWINILNGTMMSQATYNTNYTNFRPLINLTWWETNYTNFRPLINLTWYETNYTNFRPLINSSGNNLSWWETNYTNFRPLINLTWWETNYTNFRPLINLTWYETNYTANDALYRSWSLNYSNFSTKALAWESNYSNFSTGYGYALNSTQWVTSGNDIYNSNTGNVGIGTTSPSTALQVNGLISISAGIIDNVNVDGLRIQTAAGDTYIDSHGTKTYFRVGAGASENPAARTALTIDNSNGNVGIGTTSPGQKLDVVGGTIRSIHTYADLTLLQTATGTGFRWALSNDGTFRLQKTADGFSGITATPFFIDSSNNVGIGTTAPQNTLNVVGNINGTTGIFAQDNNLSTGYNYALNDSRWSLNYSNFSGVYGYALNGSAWTTNYSNFSTGWQYALNNTLTVNLTAGTNYITNNTATSFIVNNGSCWIVQGATSRFEIW